jgi:hypothetical protein
MTPEQWVLWAPCAIAFIVAASVAINNRGRLNNPMGLPKWDFNQSWASNITIAGGVVSFGILTTLLNNLETCLLPKSAYTYLVLVFPALVALAPIIFNFTREVKLQSANANTFNVTIQGRTYTFLFAAALTVWGATGQVEIQAGLVISLLQLKKMPLEPAVAIEVLFVVIFCALPFYAWRTMNAAVKSQPTLAGQHPFLIAANQARDQGWPLL